MRRRFDQLLDLGELGGALRVDEVDALEVEHERTEPVDVRLCTARTRSSSASAVAKNRPPSIRSTATPGKRLVVGVLVEVAEHLRPRLATEQWHGRAASRRRSASRATATMPITTPGSTPADSTPTIAATAIQKSKRFTR